MKTIKRQIHNRILNGSGSALDVLELAIRDPQASQISKIIAAFAMLLLADLENHPREERSDWYLVNNGGNGDE